MAFPTRYSGCQKFIDGASYKPIFFQAEACAKAELLRGRESFAFSRVTSLKCQRKVLWKSVEESFL